MKKALVTLALGTFGLGVTEFAMMGILPFIAADFGVSIAQAGHLISSYALGVCVGAPMMVAFMRTWRLKKIVLLLMGVYFVASLGMAISPEYYSMLASRFVAGLPHGAYFGVASIIADRLSKGRKSATAVAIMCSGMSVANLIGIPFGNAVGAYLGGIPLTEGYAYNYTALPGIIMVAIGIICYILFCHRYER